MRKDVPLSLEVPSPDRDRPAWVKVGVIAAVGFVIGIAWPRVFGVRLGPSAPGEAAAAAAAASASAAAGAASVARAPEAPPASLTAKTAGAGAAGAGAAAPAETPAAATSGTKAAPKVVVGKGNVVNCRTSDGAKKTGKECGAVAGLDPLVTPRVRALASCAGAEGQTGKLSLLVSADFDSGRVSYDLGKSTSVPNPTAIGTCLKASFAKASVDKGVTHEHPRYTVSYTAMLSNDGSPAPSGKDVEAAEEAPSGKAKTGEPAVEKAPSAGPEEPRPRLATASGEASIAWEVALVRDAPKVGGVVGRLPRGTKVKVGPTRDGWYAVKFGDDFGSEGWVYRGAIGR
jgi:hypothetical protein